MIDTSRCADYFIQVVNFAKLVGKLDLFNARIEYLNSYACSNGETQDLEKTRCVLGKDFAPYSFTFTMYKRNNNGEYLYWFNGGLIYHGKGSSGVDAPELAVRLGDCSDDDWSIHT